MYLCNAQLNLYFPCEDPPEEVTAPYKLTLMCVQARFDSCIDIVLVVVGYIVISKALLGVY